MLLVDTHEISRQTDSFRDQSSQDIDSQVNAFLDQVILDGRFICDVQENPRLIAEALDIELSEEAEERLASTETPELLERLYDAKFNIDNASLHPFIMGEAAPRGEITIAVGIIVVVGGIVIVAGVALAIKSRSPFAIVDHSPDAEEKY